jgi:hypothetical protein
MPVEASHLGPIRSVTHSHHAAASRPLHGCPPWRKTSPRGSRSSGSGSRPTSAPSPPPHQSYRFRSPYEVDEDRSLVLDNSSADGSEPDLAPRMPVNPQQADVNRRMIEEIANLVRQYSHINN